MTVYESVRPLTAMDAAQRKQIMKQNQIEEELVRLIEIGNRSQKSK